MPEWIKETIIAIGGGATATISILFVFKAILSKIVDKAIDTSFEKSTIKLTNKLERTTKAYEILLQKEFDYYGKLDSYLATLVPLVQDLYYWLEMFTNNESEDANEHYREHLLKYLKMIPELKNDCVMFQPYVPVNIFETVSILLKNMQSDLKYLGFVGEVMYEKNDGEIDLNKMQEFTDKVLLSISLVEARIKDRLTELSKS